MGDTKIPSCIGEKRLNRKKRKKTSKTKSAKSGLMWEFDCYIRERLRALGVIQ